MNKIIDTITHGLFTVVVFGYILYEEIVWERFAKPIVRYIQSLKLLKRLASLLNHVHGSVILIVFVLLLVFTELVGIYGGSLLLRGHVVFWLLLYVAKLPIAAFTFWLFRVTKPKLMAFAWFEKAFILLMGWIDWIKATDTYKSIKAKSAEIKHYLKKNYLRDGDSTQKKFKKIYARLKIRLKGVLKALR